MKKALIFLLCTQFYCLTAQDWVQVQSVPDNYRTDHSFAFSINDIGYMVSGNTGAGPTADFYTYDAVADQWSKKENFPGAARGFAIGDVVDGKAYFGFGNDGNSALDDFWVYDPSTDMWTELASCDCDARTHPAMVALDGFIYVGLGGSGGNKKDWWAYSIEDDSWEQRADFPAAERHHPYQFHDGEYVYVGNGHGNGFISNEWYKYDTVMDTWEQVATIPGEGRVAGTQLSHNGFGYVLSGDGDNHAFMDTGELWKYDSEIDMWIQMPPHPGRSRWAPASFIINNEMYIINGWNGVDGFLDEVYKLDLGVFDEPRLRIVLPDADELTFVKDGVDCDAYAETLVEINTPIEFSEDATLTLSIDPSSTAINGRDFILGGSESTLAAGQLSTTIELTVFNNMIADGDRTLVLNLESNQIVENSQASLTLKEDDMVFDTSVSSQTATVGEGNNTNPDIFGQFYTNMITQTIYRRSILESFNLVEGSISQMTLEVATKQSTDPYRNFTVYMANTNVDNLNAGISQALGFQQVYQGTFSSVEGINTITFDTPFEYDGESNLAIQYCFDNVAFTQDDRVVSFDVNYASTTTLKVDNISGCPNVGNVFNTTSLPVITFGEGKVADLYAAIDVPLSSTIGAGDDVYFSANDSILLSAIGADSNLDDCLSASLLTNTNELISANGTVWQDRVVFLESDNIENEYVVTLIMPNTGEIDWQSSDLTGLYTESKITNGDTPAWETLEVAEVIENDAYTFVTMNYNGMGSYAVGGSDAITSIIDIDNNLLFDKIEYFDIMGREVLMNESDRNNQITGIYLKTYLYKGVVVKTEKILR